MGANMMRILPAMGDYDVLAITIIWLVSQDCETIDGGAWVVFTLGDQSIFATYQDEPGGSGPSNSQV